MRRREFIGLVGGAAVAWPLPARAQQKPMPVIGFLNSTSQEGYSARIAAFRQGLADAGFVEGRTSRSSSATSTANTIGFLPWRPIWFVFGWR